MRRVVSFLCALALASSSLAAECRGTVYLTLDTGSMSHADNIAAILKKHDVKATFFLANERTVKGYPALDLRWSPYWKARVAEGHAFGSHTFDHGYFRRDMPGGQVRYEVEGQPPRMLDERGVCEELERVNEAFQFMTGRRLDPIWRAPGGRLTQNTQRYAERCGYQHIHWSDAGFLGDELPSRTFPNDRLLRRALESIRDGDILMMHLGIWSREEPFAPMLDPLITGLKARGFCFARITDRPAPRK